MRGQKIYLIAGLALLLGWTKVTVAQDSSPCNQYAEIQSQLGCESSNYLMAFGYHYCHRFEYEMESFSTESQKKLTQIKLCLIQSLHLDKGLTCQNVRGKSLNHHVDCYLTHGFCQMPIGDRLQVYRVVFKELFEPDVFAVATAIRSGCGFALLSSPRTTEQPE